MGIRFQCPNGHPLNVKAYLAGRRGICPQCDARFFVPAASGQRAVPADQQPEATRLPISATTESTPETETSETHETPDPVPLWYTRSESGQQFGPVETEVIRQWMVEGRVSAHSWVWRTGWAEWMRAGEAFVEMLTRPLASPPATSASGLPPPGPTQVPITTSPPQPVTLAESALAGAPLLPSAARHGRTGHRKKRQLRITIGLALVVVLLTGALLWVMLR